MLNYFPRYSQFVILNNFWHARTCLTTPNKNNMINLKLSMIFDCMYKVKTITHLFPEILAICYFEALWTCLDMSDHSQQKQQIQFVASSFSDCMQNIKTSTLFWDISNLFFQSTLGIPNDWLQHPTKMTWSIFCFDK